MMRLLPWLFLFALLWAIAPAHAERDIVYAARYYTPPGSHRTSHFHLYRINPDGTGRIQLTYGNEDDTDPHWSPDGRRIVFLRGEATVCVANANNANGEGSLQLASWGGDDYVDDACWLPDGNTVAFVHSHDTSQDTQSALWLVDVATRHTRRLIDMIDAGVSPVDSYVVSPGGSLFFVRDQDGGKIINRRTDGFLRVSGLLDEPAWLNDSELIGHDDELPLTLHFFSVTNADKARLTMRPPQPNPWGQILTEGEGWLQPSPRPGTAIYALNEHDSTVGAQAAFFQVSLVNGAMRFLALGQFLIWLPTGGHFCTAPGRDTWTYKERKWNGTFKTVWAAPLEVGTPGGKTRTVTPGLLWVTGADWRNPVR
jgi:hypothetical protein